MNCEKLINVFKEKIKAYTAYIYPDNLEEYNIFVVWSCKTLQNFKALLGTTLNDGMYYEFTYNGDKKEIYFDAYKKYTKETITIKEEV